MPTVGTKNSVVPIEDKDAREKEVVQLFTKPKYKDRSSFIYNGQVISLGSNASKSENTSRNKDSESLCPKSSWQKKAKSVISMSACCLSRHCGLTFHDESLEQFYKIYSNKQKVLHFMSILVFNFCLAVILMTLNIYSYEDRKIPSLVVISASLVITVSVFVAFRNEYIAGTTVAVLSYLIWLLILLQIVMKLLSSNGSQEDLSRQHTGDTTVWVLLLCYFAYVVLPARRVFCMIFSVSINIAHLSILLIRCHLNSDTCDREYVFSTQIIGLVILYISINSLGYMTAYLGEKKQRRSFLEIKESIIANAFIEEQLLEQEELLVSVLPRHIASNMMADNVNESKEERFRKMYMTRHENVSILFADIVGFTTLSSIKTASEVCSLLNELFTSFDDLAEKYHQLRIKILGDCYYCISGAPTPRSDHAVLCVHMGLEICEAIKVVRHKLEYSDVDMRVGVHSGKVLGGVIGQRQWQYDVMSHEVNVANAMETYGVPGRVHISCAVLKQLDDNFELEERPTPEALVCHNMKSYLVGKILKKYPIGTLDELHSVAKDDGSDAEDVSSVREENIIPKYIAEGDGNINSKLYIEMMKKDKTNSATLGKTHPVSLWFTDNDLELTYKHKEVLRCGISMLAMDLALITNLTITVAVYPISLYTLLPYLIAVGITLPLRILSLGSHLSRLFAYSSSCVSCLHCIDEYRHFLTIITTIITYAAHVTFFYLYEHEDGTAHEDVINCTNNSAATGPNGQMVGPTTCTTTLLHDDAKPEFTISGILLTLIATHLLNHVGYITRAVFMLAMATASALVIVLRHNNLFFNLSNLGMLLTEDYHNHLSAIASLCGAAFVLSFLSYQRDKTSRKLFISRIESDAQREKIGSLKEMNQKLVYNILPPYIASQFLSRTNNRALYSESYEDVAVMFIAIPQFQSFYTEEHYNNDGLECIRFLNEIISDFDEVLSNNRFNGITKIKTIGSTYMVAVGLDEKKRLSTGEEGVFDTLCENQKKRYDIDTVDSFSLDIDSGYRSSKDMNITQKRLIQLVEFALALRDQMDSINEQSFNTFMLQIGLNYGPVIGGVIGARKPHYDIWGNTVNVASRMQTTGVSGKIQLTSESEEQLRDVSPYQFTPRGKITVKGKGQLNTFLIDCSSNTENSYLWT